MSERFAVNMPLVICLSFLALTATSAVSGDELVLRRLRMLTGENFVDMPVAQQQGYALGLIDGFMLAPLFGAGGTDFRWFKSCIKEEMSSRQGASILSKYVRQHPERWHDSAHLLMYSALREMCSPPEETGKGKE